MDPGPLDPSLLALQEEHRSSEIWRGRELGTLTCRQHLKTKNKFQVPQAVLDRIAETQFYGVHKLGSMTMERDLITALVERWRQETHTFHFPFGEASVMLQDVNVLLGLKVSGKAVTGKGDYYWPAYVEQYLGRRPEPDVLDGSSLRLKWLRDNFENLPPDAHDEEVDMYLRAYLLYLIGTVLLPDKSGGHVQLIYLPLIVDFDDIDAYSWGSVALAYLYRNLCRASKAKATEISGAVVLLQLWAWERISIGRPTVVGNEYSLGEFVEIGVDPLGVRWTNVDRRYKDRKLGVVVYRDLFDKMTEDQFEWNPYPGDILEILPPICFEDPEDWLVMAPLICFDVVEWHLPQRVTRQFGWHQLIPPNCDTESDLHESDRRVKARDYPVVHKAYIKSWDDRRLYMIQPGIPYTRKMEHNDPYYQWYLQRTRRIISPHNCNLGANYADYHDYRPNAADTEEWFVYTSLRVFLVD